MYVTHCVCLQVCNTLCMSCVGKCAYVHNEPTGWWPLQTNRHNTASHHGGQQQEEDFLCLAFDNFMITIIITTIIRWFIRCERWRWLLHCPLWFPSPHPPSPQPPSRSISIFIIIVVIIIIIMACHHITTFPKCYALGIKGGEGTVAATHGLKYFLNRLVWHH